MPAPTIIVAGLGRCGSSLVMQMLAAAGAPCVGTYPDFEDAVSVLLDPKDIEGQRAFYEAAKGRAVKLLDPHLNNPPIGLDYRNIFLSRNSAEQAKSMLKLLGMANNRKARKAMEQAVRNDEARARLAMTKIGDGRYLNIPFENLIHDPEHTAGVIADWVRTWRGQPLDVEKMARCVRRRPATCLPHMLELELLAHV
jgi:hypothetical protein